MVLVLACYYYHQTKINLNWLPVHIRNMQVSLYHAVRSMYKLYGGKALKEMSKYNHAHERVHMKDSSMENMSKF